MINSSRTYIIFSGYFCKILWDPLVRSYLHSLFSLYASGTHLSSLTYLSQSPPWPHQAPSAALLPDPGAADSSRSRRRPLRARRRPLWPFLAPPAPSSPLRALIRARRRPHLDGLAAPAHGRACLRPNLVELAVLRIWASLLTPAPGGARRRPPLADFATAEHAGACPWPISPWPSSPVPAPG
jgi:hypothetical protein